MKKLILCLIFSISTLGQPSIKLIEGAFIFRFTHFVNYNKSSNSLNICVYKDNEIYSALKSHANGKRIAGIPIKIFNVEVKDIDNCHILFKGAQLNKNQKESVSRKILNNKLFTISRGGQNISTSIINIRVSNNKLIFDANRTLLNECKIKLSSKVLRLANKVY